MNRERSAWRARWPRVLAVVAALTLATAGPAGADTGTDQITGNGQTESAVSVTWAEGLVGTDNSTVVTPRDTTGPTSFLAQDFQNLKVTVSQTESLVHQAVTVSWTGGTNGGFLQIMQCYGDANTGPDPEDCEFGTPDNLLKSGLVNASAGSRGGAICASGSVPSTTTPPKNADGTGGSGGCDTAEPSDPSHIDAAADDPDDYVVPFVPAGTDQKIYNDAAAGTGQLSDYFDQFNTNEVQEADNATDGSGQDFFQALTGTEAPGLDCGEAETSGTTRDCWLVIVPRGQYDANGFKIHGSVAPVDAVTGTPLGHTMWAQRIQIHLGFAPVTTKCPIGSTQERQTVGTELVAHAVFSWQLALNAAADCRTLYSYSAVPEPTSTSQLSTGDGAGLAFTTIPVGSEVTRTGGVADTGPPLVYAPVSASAVTFGFNVNLSSTNGFDPTPIKLTPRLLAKALTQSYKTDLTDFDSDNPGPAWAANNPVNITRDPEFAKLNPTVSESLGAPVAPLVAEDHSQVNQEVWRWILADPSARAWLAGTPDENGMVVNPNYKALKLGSSAEDSFPRADPTCFNQNQPGEGTALRCTLDLLPYVNSLDEGASDVRSSNNPEGASWDPGAHAPDGSSGWWGRGGIEPSRSTFLWAVTDSASLANYGLVPAQLCTAGGGDCVSPNTASVSEALSVAKPDTAGLLHVDPAAPGSGGYPLVDVTYAAVPTTQTPAALVDYATLIDYAAAAGQTPGVEPGQLPHGYLPLPATLREQAAAAAATLRADAAKKPDTTTQSGTTGGSSGGATTGDTSNPSSGGGGGSPGGTTNTSTQAPAPTGVPKGGPAGTGQLPAKLAARTTPRDLPGALRWVLLVVVIVGVVGAFGGGVLRSSNGLSNLLRRRRG